jgi:hypothetical protein
VSNFESGASLRCRYVGRRIKRNSRLGEPKQTESSAAGDAIFDGTPQKVFSRLRHFAQQDRVPLWFGLRSRLSTGYGVVHGAGRVNRFVKPPISTVARLLNHALHFGKMSVWILLLQP